MYDINSTSLLLILITYAAIGGTGWALNRHSNLFPTFSKVFAIIIIVGLVALSLEYIIHVLDSSIARDFVSAFGSGGIVCTFKWPASVILTEDEKKRIGRRVREARRRAKGQPFDLTAPLIAELFLDQGGLCYISKKKMTWKENMPETVAICKLDPDKPYVKGNIVLTCNYVAIMKGDRSYETLLENCRKVVKNQLPLVTAQLIRQPNDDRFLIKRQVVDLESAKEEHDRRSLRTLIKKTQGKLRKNTTSSSDMSKLKKTEKEAEGGHLSKLYTKRCSICQRILPQDCYSPRGRSSPSPDGLEYRCHDCDRKRSFERTTAKSYMNDKIYACFDRAKKKNRFCDLTPKMVEALYELQSCRCYYTNDLMTWEPGHDNTASIDRIDSDRSYVEGNIALCCGIINLMKNAESYQTFLVYCQAIVENPLPLDDPRLRKRPNEGFATKRRQKARNRGSDFDEIEIERVGTGLSARLLPIYRPRLIWSDYCSPSICERVHSRTISSTDK